MKLIVKSKLKFEDEETKRWASKSDRYPGFGYECANLVVNLWYAIIINFQIIVFNYFSGYLCIMVQIMGFYFNLYGIGAK
jgi:hypothetical protein